MDGRGCAVAVTVAVVMVMVEVHQSLKQGGIRVVATGGNQEV